MATSRPLRPEDLLLGLECPVCREHYRSPRMLPCGHTLCLSPCLELITDGKRNLRCPECRMEHAVPEGGINHFPANVTVARMLETTPERTELAIGCPICGEMEEKSKCLHCGLFVCDECRQSHSEKLRDQLTELLVSLKEDNVPAALTTWAEQKSKAEASVKRITDLSIERIKSIADKAHDIITTTTGDQISAVEDFSKAETNTIDMLSENVEQNLKDVSRFCVIELKNLKRNLPSQTKMVRLLSTINAKTKTVSKTSHSLQRVVKDVNVTTELRPLEEASRRLVQVVVSQDTTETLGEVNVSVERGKRNLVTRTEDQPQARTGSVLVRDVSSVKLCVGSQGSGDSNLDQPVGLTIDPATKDIIIADRTNHRIQVFDKEGQPKRRFGFHGDDQKHFDKPEGVALTKKGHIVVTEPSKNRVKIHTRDGSFIRMLGGKDPRAGEFLSPRGVAVDGSTGLIHVCDGGNNRVVVFADNGKYKYKYSAWTSVCDQSPWCISISKDSSIAITLDNSIAVLNDRRQLLCTFKGDAFGVSWIDNVHLLVSENNQHVLKVYTFRGELVRQFGEPGYFVGQLQNPRGVAVDEDGFVYVSSCGNHMVQKF